MEKYLSNYIGVVIQNNDPEMRGRVKVFIPNVSTNLYENWNKDNNDKIFNFIDNPDIQKILDELKSVLPWAEYAGPIFGGCASGRYNATLKKGIVSDTNSFENNEPIEGYRPLRMYTNEYTYPDAFSATGKVGNNLVNPYAYQYIPSNYSNLAKGMFSIPNVGSHVWVWFRDGDSNYPVYFATAYGAEDIKRIYTMSQKTGLTGEDAASLDYPASYENINTTDLNSDSKTFRSKHVINSNKNSIEMIDTDGLEKLKLTHFSGSLMEMNNDATIKFSTGNDQNMVLGDTFNTHWKNKGDFIGGTNDLIIRGDSYEKVGNLNSNSVNEIYKLFQNLHSFKQLFDIKRTSAQLINTAFEKNVTSQFQSQDGNYAICPVCKGLPYVQGFWRMSPIHFRMCLYIPIPFPGFSGIDIWAPGVAPNIATNGQIGFVGGRYCPLCNKQNGYRYAPNHQVGFSPSTENGFWNIESSKQVYGELGDLYKSITPRVLDLQNTLGQGGDKISNVSRNFVLNVGLVMNDLVSYRVDARGKLKSVGLFVTPESTIVRPEPTPHVEHVDVDSLPGGDFIVTAGNKMKFLVGSNGINIKTFGPIEMYGTISNLTSEQMNILAKHELFIDGGEKLSLRSRNITLNPFEHNPVLVDGGLHVSRNTIIKGGMYVDGEVGVQHITAPEQWYQTAAGGCITMLVNTLLPIGAVPPHVHPVIIQLPDHRHWYTNIPLNLTKCKEQARDNLIRLGINNNTAIRSEDVIIPNDGNVVGDLQEITENLDRWGLDSTTIYLLFDAISSATNIRSLIDTYNSSQTSISNLNNRLNGVYTNYQQSVENNLELIQNAIALTFETTL